MIHRRTNELVTLLRRMKVQTGGLLCLGCGHEYNCSIRGCAILREAADHLETPVENWISTKERLPESFRPVIVCREKAKGEYVIEQGCKDVGDWWKVYGTRTKKVTHWMPLPHPPAEEPVCTGEGAECKADV
jgi:hypothetical protein